jgi:hypothetical protein
VRRQGRKGLLEAAGLVHKVFVFLKTHVSEINHVVQLLSPIAWNMEAQPASTTKLQPQDPFHLSPILSWPTLAPLPSFEGTVAGARAPLGRTPVVQIGWPGISHHLPWHSPLCTTDSGTQVCLVWCGFCSNVLADLNEFEKSEHPAISRGLQTKVDGLPAFPTLLLTTAAWHSHDSTKDVPIV